MSAAVQALRAAAVNGKPADDLWFGGTPAEPPSGQPATRRPPLPPAIKPYVPVPVPLLGGCRWPLILLEGPEFSRKSTLAFELGTADWIGQTYVLAVGEIVQEFADLVPDALLLPHDGTWHQIIGCVEWLKARAEQHQAAGDPPPLVIVDSATRVWEGLSAWAEQRARSAPSNRLKLATDPNAEIDVHPTFWTPANRRHRRLVSTLLTMPAITVMTARAKMVAEIDASGNPTRNKVYKVEAQKDLGYSATAWVRLDRDKYPTIVGLRRGPKGSITPTADDPVVIDPRTTRFAGVEFSLDWLLRVALRFDPAQARVATLVEPVAGNEPDEPTPTSAQPAVVDASEAPGAGPDGAEVAPVGEARS